MRRFYVRDSSAGGTGMVCRMNNRGTLARASWQPLSTTRVSLLHNTINKFLRKRLMNLNRLGLIAKIVTIAC